MLAHAPRLVSEVGKIRIGDRQPIEKGAHKGEPRPNKVTEFILTGNNPLILNAAATIYGGTVEEWVVPEAWQGKGTKPDHKYRLYTTTNLLKIVFRAAQLIDTARERWEGGWCVRRCNGRTITFDAYDKSLIGRTCDCPADHAARKALVKDGKACQEISRIQVQIYDLPYGYWRLDTTGYFSPAEMRVLYDDFVAYGLAERPVEAMLRLETGTARRIERTRDGEQKKVTLHFPKVVIEPIYTAAQLALRGAEVLAEAQKSLPEHVEDLYPTGPSTASTPLIARPAEKKPGPRTLDEAEFSYRLETIWQAGGLDEHAREALKARMVARCQGVIRPEWYAQLLTEQQAWVAKRQEKLQETPEPGASAPTTLPQSIPDRGTPVAQVETSALESSTEAPSSETSVEASHAVQVESAQEPDPSASGREGPEWDALREHAHDLALPEDLRFQMAAALSCATPPPADVVWKLANAVFECLDAKGTK